MFAERREDGVRGVAVSLNAASDLRFLFSVGRLKPA